MKKVLILIVIFFFSVNNISAKKELDINDNTPCRITCTVAVEDGFGGWIGVSATAGNIFTSCSTARAMACRKAHLRASHMIADMIQ